MKKWFQNDPRKSSNIVDGLNKKYGDFDFTKSSRSLCKTEFKSALNERSKFSNKRIVIVGGNDGHEKQYLNGKAKQVYVVDLAQDALKKVRDDIPIFASVEKLPFIDNFFDTYLAFRTLYSKHVDLETCLREAWRITKAGGGLIVSIPNGYLVDGKIRQGMFDYSTSSIRKDLPNIQLLKTLPILKKIGFSKIRSKVVPSEVLIFATKPLRPKVGK